MDSVGDLTVFSEVIAAGSFAGAAKRLDMTSSGVSRRISRFEERLGVRLINRTTRALVLTEAGRALLERSRGILAAVEDAEDMVRNMSLSPSGCLRVAASDAFSIQVLVPFLRDFLPKYPDLSVILIQGDGPIDLMQERVDIAIRFEQPSAQTHVSRKLIADPWIVCAAPDYLQRCGSPIRPEDLQAHNCLTIHARDRTTDLWRFADANGEPYQLQVCGAFSGIGLSVKEAALQGLGIARLAHFLVCNEIRQGRLIPLLVDYMPRGGRAIHAVYANREHVPLKSRLFIDELAAHIKRVLIIPDHMPV